MNKIINYFKSFGVDSTTPISQIRSIRLLTYIAFTCVFTALFYSILFFALGEFLPAVVDSLIVILFLPTLILTKFRKYELAKILLVINTNIAIVLVIILYGEIYRNDLFFIISSVLGVILFKKRHLGYISFGIAILFYTLVNLWAKYHKEALYPTDENLIYPLSIIGLISVAIIAFLLIKYIRNESISYERKILDVNQNLEEQKNYIMDSLNYAANIQKSVIGDKDEIIENFKDGFIILKPKDIVCGDFYWFGQVENEKIIVASDCTGHGVPAALMTIMGNDLLNEIVIIEKTISPDEILRKLDQKIINVFSNKYGEERQEGMDISILRINDKSQTISFSAAKNPIYIVKDNKIETIKGSFFPVGSNQYNIKKNYELHDLEYQIGTKIYLFSDGFQDQFGGPKGKKFMTKKFRELILKTTHIPMKEQRVILEKEFKEWQKLEEQTDDVLVIGLHL